MNVEIIESKKKETSDRFDALQSEKTSKLKEISDIDTELNRLQGEYRAFDNLLSDTADPATVIDADKALEEAKNAK